MLIVRTWINGIELISEIWIQNVGEINRKGECLYKIRKPAGFEEVDIRHRRDAGFEPLLAKALEIIKEA